MKITSQILILLIFAIQSSCVSNDKPTFNENEVIDLAVDAHESGNYIVAIQLLNKVLKRNPERILAYTNRSLSKYMIEDWDGGINDCKKVIKLDENNMLAHYLLGLYYHKKENYKVAINHYSKAANINYASPKIKLVLTYPDGTTNEGDDFFVAIEDIRYHRALSEILNNEIDFAISDLEFCVQEQYYLGSTYSQLGECHLQAEELSKACNYFQLSSEIGYEKADSLIKEYCK